MSRQIDWSEPLSEKDEAWARQFPIHRELIRINKEQFADPSADGGLAGPEAEITEVPPYTDASYWTKDKLVTEVGKRELPMPGKANKADLIAILEADDDAAEDDDEPQS